MTTTTPSASADSAPIVEPVRTDSVPDTAKPVHMTALGLVTLLGTIGFLYFARPVVLPVILACLAGMTLKPLIAWLSEHHIPRAISAAVVLGVLVAAIGIGFIQLARPALNWMDAAPQHMTELRQRVQIRFPHIADFNDAAAALNDLGATEDEKKEAQLKTPTVELKDKRGTSSIFDWTGTLLVGAGETLVLIYLLLASGDLFLQKLVRAMPTWNDKKRAVEINHEIQRNISNYLFSVSLINLCLGAMVSAGLYFMGIPNAAMWGVFVAVVNFVPYFGPVFGVVLLGAVGILTFDTLWHGLLPPGWYLLLHLVEANFVTPVLLGRRFTLNPVVIFVSLIFWTWVWGVPGALLSVPILVCIKAVCDRMPTLSSVSELLARYAGRRMAAGGPPAARTGPESATWKVWVAGAVSRGSAGRLALPQHVTELSTRNLSCHEKARPPWDEQIVFSRARMASAIRARTFVGRNQFQ